MLTNKEIGKVNSKVAQLKTIIDTVSIKNERDMKLYLEKIENINCQIIATEYLLSQHAKWVGYTALNFAVDSLETEVLGILLEVNADFTLKNSSGSTALHQMIEKYPRLLHITGESFLLAHAQTSNFENPSNTNGLSHFHVACAMNRVKVVQGFLDNGIDIGHPVKMDSPIFPGFTPLHFASKNSAFEVVEVLLSRKANIHAKNAKEMTSLHVALDRKVNILNEMDTNESLIYKADKILKMFLEKEGNDEMLIIDEWGLSHFHAACTLKDSKIAESYVQKVINISHAVNVNSPLWAGYTALHFAALCNVDTVKSLVKKGADISIKDTKGVSPFDICIKKYKAEDIYAILSLDSTFKNIMLSDGRTRLMDLVFAMRNSDQFSMFLRKLSKNFIIYNSPLWSGYSPMHLAVIFSSTSSDNDKDTNIQILRNLCQHNPNMVFSKDIHGHTPLHLAFRLRKRSALDVLFNFLEKFPHIPDRVDEDGLSYLHIASAKNKVNVLNGLLASGIYVNTAYTGKTLLSPTVYSGTTALHLAVIYGSVNVVDTLLKRGADLYAKDANGMTPIHLTLLRMNKKITAMLLSSPNLQDSVVQGIGLSHLHVACLYGQPEHVELLLNAGADINAVVTYEPKEEYSRLRLKEYAGHSMLLLTYTRDKHRIVEILLRQGAKIFVDNAKEMELLYKMFESKFDDPLDNFLKSLVKSDSNLMIRLIADTGMTIVHVACLEMNIHDIARIMSVGADVNVQVRTDSPIFRGYTPLHVIMCVCKNINEDVGTKLIELFVARGADVTLRTAKSETAVHMAYKAFYNTKDELNYLRLNMLLEAQRDFSVNPTSVEGISHFHIACSVCNVGIVEKFLSQGNIDIDQPIDYFYENESGYSPLHLAAGSKSNLCGAWKQLPTIDLLLKNGADIRAEDAHADTPLHECARFASLDVFERLVRAGADVNARNIRSNTPLSYYLVSDNVTTEGIKALLRFGCELSVFDAFDYEACLGVIVSKLPYADVQKLVSALIVNFASKLAVDNLGRTVIHNVVSVNPASTSGYQYAELIDKLSNIECDVDTKDHLGRTALHFALQFHNFQAISGLLMAGADINSIDVNDDDSYKFNECSRCWKYDKKIFGDSDEENENEQNDSEGNMCQHLETMKTLAIHVKKLQMCGLDVNKKNEDLARDTFEKIKIKTEWSEGFLTELETIKNTRIGSHSLTLHDFISENRAVADYPTMSQMKRNDVAKVFSPFEVLKLREKFPEVAGILQLQYRKAKARPQLVESGKNSMGSLIGFRLPEICSNFILAMLKNSELKNLIATTN